jgi:hypothetical protein
MLMGISMKVNGLMIKLMVKVCLSVEHRDSLLCER